MHARVQKLFIAVIALASLSSLFGCAGKEFAPRSPYMYWYYPKELPQADRDLEKLRQSCPEFYKEEKARVDRAYEEYAACKTPDIRVKDCPPPPAVVLPPAPRCELTASKMEITPGESVTLSMTTSGEVTSIDLEGSHDTTKIVSPMTTTTYTGKVTGPGGSNSCATVTVSVKKPEPPRCSLKTDKSTIELGGSVSITMTTSGEVTSAMMDNESVATTGGTIQRKPSKAITYSGKVEGPGGSSTCNAPVSISLTLNVHFPFDRPKGPGSKNMPPDDPETWFIKPDPDAFNTKDSLDPCNRDKDKKKMGFDNPTLQNNRSLLQKAVGFVNDNPGTNVKVTGHTDCIGSAEYNAGLSDRRAHAVAAYIRKEANLGDKDITWSGRGFNEPLSGCDQFKGGKCDRGACDCRARNRRVMIIVSPR